MEQLTGLVEREQATLVGERVQDGERVRARFDHLVEIADCPLAYGDGQWAIDPDRLVPAEQKTPREVARGQVIVARDGDERAFETPGHVFHKTCLSAPGRPLEEHGDGVCGTG